MTTAPIPPLKKDHAPLFLVLEETGTIRRELYEREGNPQWVPLFDETQWAAYIHRSPLLIKVEPQSPVLEWFLKHRDDDERLRGLILESEASLAQVAEWGRIPLTMTFNNNRQGLLRYYDPLIWHAIAPGAFPGHSPVTQAHYWYHPPWYSEGQWLSSPHPMPLPPGTNALSEEQSAALAQLEQQQAQAATSNTQHRGSGKESAHG